MTALAFSCQAGSQLSVTFKSYSIYSLLKRLVGLEAWPGWWTRVSDIQVVIAVQIMELLTGPLLQFGFQMYDKKKKKKKN